MNCPKCNDTKWVCENHEDQEAHACKLCGGAGVPCIDCNPLHPDFKQKRIYKNKAQEEWGR